MSRPTLRTEFCERVGIEYPIVLAGMGPVASTGSPTACSELVAAVSNAGGLGVGDRTYKLPPITTSGYGRYVKSLRGAP